MPRILTCLALVIVFLIAPMPHARAETSLGRLTLHTPPAGVPRTGTLVLVLPANLAGSALLYSSLLRSLTDAGHHAAFVSYQSAGGNSAGDAGLYKDRILAATSEAVKRTRPARIVFVGHSSGGYLAQYLANHFREYKARYPNLALPLAAVILLEASSLYSATFPDFLDGHYPIRDLTGIDASTVVVHLVAESSGVLNCQNSNAGFHSLWEIDWLAIQRFQRKNFLMIPNQSHGKHKLVSHHLDPLSTPVNQFDRFGYERMTAATVACVSNKTRCPEALGRSAVTVTLGKFDDGTPLSPMLTPEALFSPGGRADCDTLRDLNR